MTDYTHYEILDVDSAADASQIKAAYQRAVRVAHPDVGGTAAMFGMVRTAYEVLSDPETRAAYDAEVLRGGPSGPYADATESDPDREPSFGVPRNSYRRTQAPTAPPEPEWGEEIHWSDGTESVTNRRENSADVTRPTPPSWDRPAPAFSTHPGTAPRSPQPNRLLVWAVSRPTTVGVWIEAGVLVTLYVVFATILFGNPAWIRPEAATPDFAHWAFVEQPFMRLIVAVYTGFLFASAFGAARYLLAAHFLGAVGLVVWLTAYWSVADALERLAFTGLSLLWIVYCVLLVLVPLTVMSRRQSHS